MGYNRIPSLFKVMHISSNPLILRIFPCCDKWTNVEDLPLFYLYARRAQLLQFTRKKSLAVTKRNTFFLLAVFIVCELVDIFFQHSFFLMLSSTRNESLLYDQPTGRKNKRIMLNNWFNVRLVLILPITPSKRWW